MTVPVFTDPSGQRRRLVRVIGAGVSVLCVGALVIVAIALVGGPSSPFPLWAQNPAQHSAQGNPKPGNHRDGRAAPGSARLIQPNQVPAGGGSGSPAHPTSSAKASPSPSPTKKHLPRRSHSKTPHPRPSHSHPH